VQLTEEALRRFANLVMRNHAQAIFSDTDAEIGEAVDFVVRIERQPGRRILREVRFVDTTGSPSAS
jgi:pilus assembly protein CpaF